MISALISLVIGVLSFQVFSLTYQLGGINRTIVNMPKAVLEKALVLERVNSDKYYVYFDQDNLILSIKNYLDDNMSKYCDQYDIETNYYLPQLNNRPCTIDKCNGVNVTITCRILLAFDYSKTMYYEIVEGAK